jgi:hypothetical protein
LPQDYGTRIGKTSDLEQRRLLQQVVVVVRLPLARRGNDLVEIAALAAHHILVRGCQVSRLQMPLEYRASWRRWQ